jgi:hypothetical protein
MCKIVMFGGILVPVTIPQNPLMLLCFVAQCFSSKLVEFGRLGPLANVGSFCGLWLTTNVGQQLGWLRGLTQSLLCPLCDQHDESINHLLVGCSFARLFWFELFRTFGLQGFIPGHDIEDFDLWWCSNSARLDGLSKKGFDYLVALGAWMLWKHRNGVVFNGSSPSLVVVVQLAGEEALLWSLAGAKGFPSSKLKVMWDSFSVVIVGVSAS